MIRIDHKNMEKKKMDENKKNEAKKLLLNIDRVWMWNFLTIHIVLGDCWNNVRLFDRFDGPVPLKLLFVTGAGGTVPPSSGIDCC